MAHPSLVSLPREILRQIGGNLPCRSALNFLLVFRIINEVCDDWTVWRAVVLRDDTCPEGVVTPQAQSHDGWKRYVVAAAKFLSSNENKNAIELECSLPRLFAVCHQPPLRCNPMSRQQLRNPVFTEDVFHSLNRLTFCHERGSFHTYSVVAWQSAQAMAFSLALRRFALELSNEISEDVKSYVP